MNKTCVVHVQKILSQSWALLLSITIFLFTHPRQFQLTNQPKEKEEEGKGIKWETNRKPSFS